MWAESQPGPSRCQPGRQGYCGYCRVLYSDLDQHLSSLIHLDSVRTSSRGSSTVPPASSWTRWTLLDRFLSDVLEHHPHHYHDPRPSHADLPPVSTLPAPRVELDELRYCGNDGPSPGTPEPPDPDDASSNPANREKECSSHSQSGEEACRGRLSSPIREQESCTRPSQPEAPPPRSNTACQTPPTIHRKAHRKTNRRKASESSSSQTPLGPRFRQNPTEPRLWRGGASSSDLTDPLDRTIEEVIRTCCHDAASSPRRREETESLHLSLPVSVETQSERWDAPVQVAGPSTATPVQVTQVEGRDLSRLMDLQVDLQDQVYSHQLNRALRSEPPQDEGFWTLPIEEVLPVPQHLPQSFRGKSWTQIEREDEEKVERLVRQFQTGTFRCYFDSESLARYGRRSHGRKAQEAEPDAEAPPLVERDGDDSAGGRRRRGRSFRLASRCQVVKVSHGTQTVRLVVPAAQTTPETPPISVPAANRSAAERTPEMQTWRCLPASYSNIMSPVQPRTSLVYLLCSDSGSSPATPQGSAHKRCRKRRRPLELQRLKLTYKPLPVRFYEPRTNRVLRNPPKGLSRHPGSAPSGPPPPPCVRQLFRNLSPDLNTDRTLGTDSKSDGVVLSELSGDARSNVSRRRRRTPHAPPPARDGPERGRGVQAQPSPSKRRAAIQAPPLHPRREGLRPGRQLHGSTSPAPLPSRRGRGRRGRGCKRAGR